MMEWKNSGERTMEIIILYELLGIRNAACVLLICLLK